jgi:hypothetical protein
MSVSTVTALPYPQWRMMNVLDGAVRKPATVLLNRCDASQEDLLSLWEAGLVAATLDNLAGDVDLGLLRIDHGLLNDYDVRIRLTPAGIRWVNESPSNRALLAVDELGGHKQVLLTDAARKADVELSAYLLLASVDLVSIIMPGGSEVRQNDTLALRAYRTSLRVHLTATGRLVINS